MSRATTTKTKTHRNRETNRQRWAERERERQTQTITYKTDVKNNLNIALDQVKQKLFFKKLNENHVSLSLSLVFVGFFNFVCKEK